MSVHIPARLVVRGIAYSITVQNISRFGAFIVDLPLIAPGIEVELDIPVQGPCDLRIVASVVYWVAPATARRLGTRPGTGLRFHEPLGKEDTCLLAQQTLATSRKPQARAARPTLRMPALVQSGLVSAMTGGTPEPDGRVTFAGDLATIGLTDVVAALARLHMCGRLEVTHGDIVATLDLSDGDILDVRSSIEAPDRHEFLVRVLSWDTGSFRLLAIRPHSTQRCRVKVSQQLLLHARSRQIRPSVVSAARR